ncbi:hypothetical protein D3C81_1721610 [compost metagenome]
MSLYDSGRYSRPLRIGHRSSLRLMFITVNWLTTCSTRPNAHGVSVRGISASGVVRRSWVTSTVGSSAITARCSITLVSMNRITSPTRMRPVGFCSSITPWRPNWSMTPLPLIWKSSPVRVFTMRRKRSKFWMLNPNPGTTNLPTTASMS